MRQNGWTKEVVDKRASIDPSLAVAPDGTVFVGYEYLSSQSDHACVLATRAGSAWSLLNLALADGHSSSSGCTCRSARDGTVHMVAARGPN